MARNFPESIVFFHQWRMAQRPGNVDEGQIEGRCPPLVTGLDAVQREAGRRYAI
jgi:hypothetical protein